MKPDLDDKLCEKYPKIFCKRHAPETETAMCWGFECDDGWYDLIDTMCAVIQNHIDWAEKSRSYSVERGEVPTTAHIEQVVANQVKEKFGTLRFYYTGGDEFICGVVNMAESLSAKICEECGTPGKIRADGWIRTLCDTHSKKDESNL